MRSGDILRIQSITFAGGVGVGWEVEKWPPRFGIEHREAEAPGIPWKHLEVIATN